jgi:hypothetical protein
MKFKEILYNLLTEDQEGVYRKYFSDIDRTTFIRIASADPKTKIVNDKIERLGSYYRFLIEMHRKGTLKNEDLPKAKEYLELVYKYQLKIGQMKIESISDLYELVKDKIAKTQTTLVSLIGALGKEEYEVILNGNSWFIVVPKTEKASAYLGANTEWCTTWGTHSLNPNYKDRTNHFSSHNQSGPLYIIVNKDNENDKYQLHFSSDQLKNPSDSEIGNRPKFFNDRLEVKMALFPNVSKTGLSKEEIKDEISKAKKFLSDADRENLMNQLYDAYADVDNQLVKALIKDDEETLQNMVDGVNISSGVLTFTVKGLPQSVDNYNDYIRNMEMSKENAWNDIYENEEYNFNGDGEDILTSYLDAYYDKNKTILIDQFGKFASTLEIFSNTFLSDMINDGTIKEKYCEGYAEGTSSALENAIQAELDHWKKYLEVDAGWSDNDIRVPVENLIEFVAEREIKTIENVDSFLEDYVDFFSIPTDYYELPEHDWISPTNEAMFEVFDKYFQVLYDSDWFDKIVDGDETDNCAETKQKFITIVKEHFQYEVKFENEFVKLELEKPWMKNFDCEKGIKVKYHNKKNGENYEGYMQVDSLMSHINSEPLFEKLNFKNVLKDLY